MTFIHFLVLFMDGSVYGLAMPYEHFDVVVSDIDERRLGAVSEYKSCLSCRLILLGCQE